MLTQYLRLAREEVHAQVPASTLPYVEAEQAESGPTAEWQGVIGALRRAKGTQATANDLDTLIECLLRWCKEYLRAVIDQPQYFDVTHADVIGVLVETGNLAEENGRATAAALLEAYI